MLVISRKANQSIVVPELGIEIEVLQVKGHRVRLGISAPREIQVYRGELLKSVELENLTNADFTEPSEVKPSVGSSIHPLLSQPEVCAASAESVSTATA